MLGVDSSPLEEQQAFFCYLDGWFGLESWEEKFYFLLYFEVSLLLREVRAGIQACRQKLKWRPLMDATYSMTCSACFDFIIKI